MSSFVSFPQRLLERARDQIRRGGLAEAARTLDHIIHHPKLDPAIACEGNFLLAQVRFALADLSGAEQSARKALALDADNPDYHHLLGRMLEESDSDQAGEHFSQAARLSPNDPRKVLSFGKSIADRKDHEQGVRLIESAYAHAPDDPDVVESVMDGLLDHGRIDEAELVVTQALYRHIDDRRFRLIRDRFRARRCELMLTKRAKGSDGAMEIIPYRNPILSARKPGGAKRPDRSKTPPAPPVPGPVRTTPTAIDEGMSLLEILRRSGSAASSSIYHSLGLLGKDDFESQAREIASFLSDADSLERIIRDLPPASRKLLGTLVQLGGYVPATTVFQTTGVDAPPPDYAQSLIALGLVVFGQSTRGRRPMVLAVPFDLLGRLARILKVTIGG
jgi:tetratricopeptide (TPR) repeat protein